MRIFFLELCLASLSSLKLQDNCSELNTNIQSLMHTKIIPNEICVQCHTCKLVYKISYHIICFVPYEILYLCHTCKLVYKSSNINVLFQMKCVYSATPLGWYTKAHTMSMFCGTPVHQYVIII